MLSGQITERRRMIMKCKLGMSGGDVPIVCRMKADITIASGPKTESIRLEILGLPTEAPGQVVQHDVHGDAT